MATKIKNVAKNISINQAASSVNGTTTVTKNTIYNDIFKVANDIDYVEINSTNNKSSDVIYLQGVRANNPALRVAQETINVDGDVIFTKNLVITYRNKYGLLSTVVIKDYFTTEEGLATNSTIKKIRLQNPDNPSKTVDYNLADGIELRNAMGGSVVGNTINGTVFSDKISVAGIDGKVVNAGAGDDYIESGAGNDTITGGSGRTRFIYGEGSGEDTIYLTKDEQLEIEYNSSSPFKGSDFSFEKSGNDVVITRLGVNDKIIIKNAFKAGAKSIAFQAGDLIWDVLNGAYNFYSDGEVPDDPDYSSIVYNNYGKKNVTSKGILNGSSTADEIILADYTNKKKTGVKINAGAGNDSVVSSVYNDTIKAGAGNDTIIAIGGNNKIYGEGGNDEIHISSEKGNNYIDGGAGNDYLTGAKGNDTIKGGSGNDTISEWAGKNVLYGGAGNDYISGGEGNDKMYGDAGNDTIFSYSGNDTIYAGAGNDRVEVITGKNTIYAQKGNNTIYGGEGSDKIYAGSGNDKIYYCVGGGKDTIYNATSKTTLAIYDSNVDLNMRDLTFVKKGNNLIIALKAQGNADGTLKYSDSITIANYYKSKNKISNIEILGRYRNYLPYSEQTLANLMKNQGVYQVGNKVTGINGVTNVIVGTSKNDTLNGGNSMDMFAGGKGNDIIKGGKGTTLVQYRAGDGNDTIQLTKGETVQIMYTLDAGTDISSMDEDDIINMFSIKESGKDVIISRKWNNNGKTVTDKIIIKNMTLNNLAQDITMGICDSTNHEITSIDLLEKQYLLQGKASYNKKTKKYSGATINGTNLNEEIVGTDYADTIKAGSGEDVIIGGKGNDKLYGGAGENLYQINKNDGNDIIYTASGNNIINFNYGTADDYKIERKGNDVIISAKDPNQKNSVTVKDYFKTNKDNVQLSFQAGTKVSLKNIMQGSTNIVIDKSSATKKQTITGTLLSETLIGGKAGDLIKSIGGFNSVDGGAGNDTIYGGNGYDDISGGSGNDLIYGGANVQYISGDAGNDTMYSGSKETYFELEINHGNDVIDAKKGDNIIKLNGLNLADMKFSKKGNDIIITNKNSKGKDETTTIKNYLKYGKDNVYIEGADFEETLSDILNKKIEGANVVINNAINQSKAKKKQNIIATLLNDKITGSNYNDTIKAGTGDDIVSGGKGNDKIYAQAGNNTIDGGLGNDTIYAGTGNDTIIHKAGQGKDVIYNITSNTSIEISGVEDEDSVAFIKSGNDLIIATDAEWNLNYTDFTYKSSVTVKNYFRFENQHIGLSITSKDGYPFEPTYLDWEMEDNDLKISGKGKINGLDGTNDMLIGSSKNDTITIAQNSYVNTVEAGKGNDVIKTAKYTHNGIYYNQGDGNDTIYVTDKSNISLYYTSTDKKPLKESDFKFTQSGNDLIITRSYKVTTKNSKGKKVTKTVTDKITLKNGANPEISANIEVFAATKEQIESDGIYAIHKILTGNEYGHDPDTDIDKKFYASVIDKNTATKAQEIMGTGINDYIVGSDYNDKIYTGEGIDYIEAGKGDDTIIVRQNKTDSNKTIRISNGDGNDTIKGIGTELEASGSEIIGPPSLKPSFTLAFDEGTTVLNQAFSRGDGHYDIVLHRFYSEGGVTKHETTTLTDVVLDSSTNINIKLGNDEPIDLNNLNSIPENFEFDENATVVALNSESTLTGGQNYLAFGSSEDDVITIINDGGTANIIDLQGANTFNIEKGTNNITTGEGDDEITISGGTNGITTGDGEDNFTISGGTNTINTGDDNDEVSITGGTNTITGGYGFVEATISGGENTLNASTSDTYIKVLITGGNNTIDSTSPSANNVSTYANVTLQGGTNNFTGGSQRDYVTISGGQNTINTGGGKDKISIEGGTDDDTNSINTEDGNDEIFIKGGLHNTINGGIGNDEFYIVGGTNISINGGAGGDIFTIEGGTSSIYGGADIDTFSITGGENTIDGEAGADDYIIEGGTNTINDTGTDIANTFKISSGTNGITTSATGNENYTITGGTNTVERAGNITATISGGENTIYAPTGTINASNGTNHIYARAGESETAQGGNVGATITGGTAYMYAGENDNYANAVSISGGTNHEINTGGGADNVTISGGGNSGASTKQEVNTGKGADSITIEGGYNYILDSGTDDDVININGGAAEVYANEGNDKITVNSDNATIIEGGAGNDTIAVLTQTPTTQNIVEMVFNNGDGHDVIGDVLNNYITTAEGIKENCILQFKDATSFSDLGIDIKQGTGLLDLIIRYNYAEETKSYKDSVTIKNYKGTNFYLMFKDNYIHQFSEYVNFVSHSENDTIYGQGASVMDILVPNPNKPNQTVDLNAGKDKVCITKGNFTINPGTDNLEDTIVFVTVNSIDDLTVKLSENNSIDGTDAIIEYTGNDNQTYRVTVADYSSATYKVMQIQTKDGQTIGLNELIKPEYNGSPAINESIQGSAFDDNITATYNYHDNSKRMTINGGEGDDTIVMENSTGNVSLWGGAGNDYIVGGDGNDDLRGAALGNSQNGNDTIYGGGGNDNIDGYPGNDLLYGEIGNDIIDGGAGNDTIYGGLGNDSINPNNGNDIAFGNEGNDTISAGSLKTGIKIYDGGAGNDSVIGGKDNDTIYGGTGSDTISGGNGDDIIYGCGSAEPYFDTLTGTFTYQEITNESARIELTAGVVDTLDGGAGNDTIYAGATKNILTGGKGNDVICGYSGGNNTFNFSLGHGNDTIYTGTSGKNYDIMKFTDVALADISLELNGADAVVTYSENDSVTVKNFAGNIMYPIYVEDKDGNRTLLSALYSMDVPADALQNDTIEATLPISWNVTSGNGKTVYCSSGNDTINCSRNDTIYGGDGTNTYLVTCSISTNGSFPTTTIISTSNKDILVFRDGSGNIVNANNINYTKPSGTADLQIKFTVTGELYEQGRNVILKDYFLNPVKITLQTASENKDLYNEIKTKNFSGIAFGTGTYSSSYKTIIGSNSADNLKSTSSYKTSIFAGEGNDNITSGTGEYDSLYGGLGNDIIDGSAGGYKYIYGGEGADSITGGNDCNSLYGTNNQKILSYGLDAPTDTIVGGNRSDYLYAYGENALMQGGGDNDFYEAYLSNIIKINDTQGSNTITITSPDVQNALKPEDIYFAFNGSITMNNGIMTMGGAGKFYILNAESYEKWKNGASIEDLARIELDNQTFNANINMEDGIKICLNYENSNTYASWAEINAFMQDVVGWIDSSGYGSINNILSRHNKGEIDASQLIAKFDDFHLIDHSGMA